MKITRTVDSTKPEKCSMFALGFFGKERGRVVYNSFCLDGKAGYAIGVNGHFVGAATDFYHACDMLLNEIGVIKTKYI